MHKTGQNNPQEPMRPSLYILLGSRYIATWTLYILLGEFTGTGHTKMEDPSTIPRVSHFYWFAATGRKISYHNQELLYFNVSLCVYIYVYTRMY